MEWCIVLLEDNIARYGAQEIYNSDQGVAIYQYQYIDVLKEHNTQISKDGKGRAMDNIYIERFWKSLKFEKIYLDPPNGGLDLHLTVRGCIKLYNAK
ncbi:hypothetical protein [Arenibacter certesii]|uniref:Integrase catalytic domain-containing protein n=1 Tax=Arenibacter certesii TaxID=228955 RepID=A0A918IX56_9FLAO|nr:hypothetical protein [Arenibacter certesii]GGW36266.1 hypothetical protein GCM10007383_21500 [Arenibacter certesii]